MGLVFARAQPQCVNDFWENIDAMPALEPEGEGGGGEGSDAMAAMAACV